MSQRRSAPPRKAADNDKKKSSPVVLLLLVTLIVAGSGLIYFLTIGKPAPPRAALSKATIAADGTYSGSLAVLDSIAAASANFTSFKLTTSGSFSPKANIDGNISEDNATSIVVQPSMASFQIGSGKTASAITYINEWQYVKNGDNKWTRILQPKPTLVQKVWDTFEAGTFQQFKRWTGSTVSIYKDETLKGRSVGVIEIDPSTCSACAALNVAPGIITIRYDKASMRLMQMTGTLGQGKKSGEANFSDWDSADNKVFAPI